MPVMEIFKSKIANLSALSRGSNFHFPIFNSHCLNLKKVKSAREKIFTKSRSPIFNFACTTEDFGEKSNHRHHRQRGKNYCKRSRRENSRDEISNSRKREKSEFRIRHPAHTVRREVRFFESTEMDADFVASGVEKFFENRSGKNRTRIWCRPTGRSRAIT